MKNLSCFKYRKKKTLLSRLNSILKEEKDLYNRSSFHAANVYLNFFDKTSPIHNENFIYIIKLFNDVKSTSKAIRNIERM